MPDLSLTHSLNSVCVLVVLLVFVLKVICIQYAIGITGNLSGWFVLKRLQKADAPAYICAGASAFYIYAIFANKIHTLISVVAFNLYNLNCIHFFRTHS